MPDSLLSDRQRAGFALAGIGWTHRGLAPCLLLGWMFVACIYPLYDTDFWWHLKTGQLILQQGMIPQVDWFSYTDFDKPWIDLHWGFQVLIATLYLLGGIPLITLVKAAIYTATLAVGMTVPSRRTLPGITVPLGGSSSSPAEPAPRDAHLPGWLLALTWIPSAICLSGRALERPEMLTLLFLACVLWIAFRSEQRPQLVWLLAPVMLVWVNCHALFVLGVVVWIALCVDLVLRGFLQGRFRTEPLAPEFDLRTFALGTLAASVVTLINPYFLDGLLFPLTLYRKFSVDQAFYAARIGEFQPPIEFLLKFGPTNLYLNAQILLAALLLLSSLALLVISRISPLRWMLLLAFSHLAWKASRNTAPFALVGGVLLACNLRELLAWQAVRRQRRQISSSQAASIGTQGYREKPLAPAAAAANRSIAARSMTIGVASLPKYLTCAVLASGILLVVSGLWNDWGEKNKPFRLGEAVDWFPHAAARFAGQPGMPKYGFIAHIGQASVYEYHNGPERLVFMDPRLEVMSQATFERYEAILKAMSQLDPRWLELIRAGDGELPAILLDSRYSRAAINGLLQTPGMRLVFADRTAAVFITDSLADQLKLPPVSFAPLSDLPEAQLKK